MWRRSIAKVCFAFVIVVTITCLGYASIPYLPRGIRQPVARFYYNYLSLSPSNNEPYGVYLNKPFGPDDELVIAFYDGRENHVLIIRPGGDDHRHAAMQTVYHLRVNAPSGKEAVRYLREFFAKLGFRGSIRTSVSFAHGAPARPMLGRSILEEDLFSFLSEYRPQEGYADLAFVSCDVAKGDAGRKYIQQIADTYSLRVSASEESVSWYIDAKWLKSNEGKRNFEFEPQNWLTAIPHEKEPKRYREILAE